MSRDHCSYEEVKGTSGLEGDPIVDVGEFSCGKKGEH